METQIIADDSATPNAGAQEGDQAVQTVEQLKAELDAVKAQNAKYSVALHTFTKRLDKFESAARAIPDIEEHLTANGSKAKTQSVQREDQSIRERLERVEARERAQKEREKIAAISSALEAHDVDSSQSKRFARLIAIEQADKISVDDEMQVTFDDAGNLRDVRDWMRDYLQTDDGRLLVPAKRTTKNNSSAQSGGSATGVTYLTSEEFNKNLTLAEMKSGRYAIKPKGA